MNAFIISIHFVFGSEITGTATNGGTLNHGT